MSEPMSEHIIQRIRDVDYDTDRLTLHFHDGTALRILSIRSDDSVTIQALTREGAEMDAAGELPFAEVD